MTTARARDALARAPIVSNRPATSSATAASHGCIRIDNDEIDWMAAHIQPGTPVDITG
jgi:lipoprotein-anchoring transpeptidase ErfK/SrfK